MKVIGLTGGIGTGKSTASQFVRQKGYPVIDADLVAREMVLPGMPILEKLTAIFGEEILLRNGSLNRKALGQIVFDDETKRKTLDQLMHTEIIKAIWNRIALLSESQLHSAAFIDAPLLFETGMDKKCDTVWLIKADLNIRVHRITLRDQLTSEEVMARINSQMEENKKEQRADEVIDNSGSEEYMYQQLDGLLKKL